jgi:lyso-ornithine lipid O-acyltransferase
MLNMMRGLWRMSLFLGLLLILMPVQLLLLKIKPHFLPRFFHKIMMRVLNIHLTQEGKAQKALLVSNHTSWLDILVLGSTGKLCFIAKSDVASWPLFGFLARLQKTIFVERDNRLKVVESLTLIKQRLNESPLVLFAEGTTSDGTKVLPFLSSLIFAPAQPVVIMYDTPQEIAWYGEMSLPPHFWAVFKRRETKVRVIFHPVLQEGNRKEIAAQAEKTVRESFTLKMAQN